MKLLGAGLLAIVAMLVVLPVAGASAKSALVFTNEGTPVEVGGKADIGVFVAGCYMFSEGTVTANKGPKGIVQATKNAAAECFVEGESVSGMLTEWQSTTSGKTKITGTVEVTKPGPCVYDYAKFKGSIPVPGNAFFEGIDKGKLNKTLSNPEKGACEKKSEVEYGADLGPGVLENIFGEELE